MNPFDATGIAGLVLLLIAFLAAETNRITARGYRFNATNAVGSALLGIYAWSLNSWIFVTLESVWAVAAIYFLIQHHQKKKTILVKPKKKNKKRGKA